MCSTSVKNDVKITVEITSVYASGFRAKVSNGMHWIEGNFSQRGKVKEWLKSAHFSFNSPTPYYSKEMNRAVSDIMGRPPRLLHKFAWAAFFEQVVRPNERLINMYGRRKGQSVYFPDVAKIFKNRTVLTQALKDNQTNILPLILSTGLSPKEMKKLYGKGLWKNLAKNSHHRNRQISRVVGKISLADFPDEVKSLNSNFFEIFATVAKCRRREEEVKNILRYMKSWPVAHIKRLGPLERTVTILGDSFLMAQQLEQKIPNNLLDSLDILFDFHDNLAQREREVWQIVQDKGRVFDLSDSWIPKESSYEDANAVAILTTEQLDREGKIMHHCVAGYARQVARGEYLVYHLSDGKEEATLGVHLVNNVWVYQQMYRECNQIVNSPVLKQLAEKLIKEINEAYKEMEECRTE